ncbi:MAG: SoxR reducing system RseC family protein [Clostridia bacterium]|nr:SoxR reducing system RseC family protein [Clostridia bacterium]
MRQTGKVISVSDDGKKAIVRFSRTDACGKCHACFTLSSTEADIELENNIGAAAGDEVIIQLHSNSVLKASLIMYGVPLVALLIGTAIGSLKSDMYAFLGGVLFACGAFFIIKAFEPKFERMNSFKPRIIEKKENGQGE